MEKQFLNLSHFGGRCRGLFHFLMCLDNNIYSISVYTIVYVE